MTTATDTDPNAIMVATEPNPDATLVTTATEKTATGVIDADKVSAAMGSYMLQGWTPLMRNREATSQICVNCQMNPPIDPEEVVSTSPVSKPAAETEPAQATQPLPPPPLSAIAALTMPAPTTALPSLPPAPRSTSPQNRRGSALDPMVEARKALRPVGSRNIGGSAPRSSTVPLPPGTPPPSAGKNVSGPLLSKPAIPLPAGPPPSLPLSPPPSGVLAPQPVPRDMRRSPQSSMVLSGNILPPTTPPPPPPNATTSGPLPSPPTGSPPAPTTSPNTGSESATIVSETVEEVRESPILEESATKEKDSEPEAVAVVEATITEESNEPAAEKQPGSQEEPAPQEPVQETNDKTVQEPLQEPAQGLDQQATQTEGEDEDKGMESDDDFEDAEEEVFRPNEEEIKERESKRAQSDRASKLIGQKMLQGWTMLQDPCPNASCHGVPLLRSREKKEYCVVCENYFQREQDLEHGKYTIVSSDTTLPPTSPVAPASSNTVSPPPQPQAPESSSVPPQSISPPINPLQRNASISVSPNMKANSPISSPSMGRSQRELLGRVSNPIALPPAVSPSFTMVSQQILGKHLSEDLDKLAAEDEETRRHIQIIRKVGEFSNKSLPPVPSAPAPPPPAAAHNSSRPMSTYSNSSDHHPSEFERQEIRRHHSQRHGPPPPPPGHFNDNNVPAPPSVPASPEVLALVNATYKTIATILVKLEVYRQALEITDNPKECQVLTSQIKGLMECLKACREAL
ncbi:hypothetical protein BGX21_006266 [Mortierella sp. AD011]|nr:hypothetical protein BGX20_007190 [Mortierella sp. AD010]KAF9399428.1 hypothetical protein BGX21_006266 [Mortierella sp. AD011]